MNFYGSQAAQAPARRPEPGPGEQPCPPPRPAAHSGRSCKNFSRKIKYININIKNIGIIHNREFEEGVLRIEFYDEDSSKNASLLLQKYRYIVYER